MVLVRSITLLILVVTYTFCQENPANPANDEINLNLVFDPNILDGYQRKYTTYVQARKEDCYFIEGAQKGQLLNFHFMVS